MNNFEIFVRKLFKNKLAFAGLIFIIFLIFIAIFAPWIAPDNPDKMSVSNSLLGIGQQGHLLGTDNYGRDILSRLIYGARISLIVGVGAVFVGAFIGVVLGVIAGYFGGFTDALIMRFMDALSAFPFILLAIVLMTVLSSGLGNVIIAVGIGNIPGFAKIARGQVLATKESDYIEVTRSLGASSTRIIFDHILPNSAAPIIVYGTMNIAGAIISEAALSFLGLGIQPPTPSWGNMLKDGQDYLVVAPHLAIFSGIAILLSVLAFNVLGDGLRDALDPKTKL